MNKPIIYEAEASELATGTPVLIEVKIEWNRARIEERIREVFPEAPNTAVAIAKCESGLVKDVQSHRQTRIDVFIAPMVQSVCK